MGIQLVAEVMDTPLGLAGSHAARTALIVMARYAVDDHQPPLYFGGWRKIAKALELQPADGPDPHRNQRVTVSRLLRRLAALELIEKVSPVDDKSSRLAGTWVLRRDRWQTLRLERETLASRAEAVDNLPWEVA